MKGRLFNLTCLALALLSWTVGSSWSVMDEVVRPWWSIAVVFVSGSTALSRSWVVSAAKKSPMGFVNAVNGTTAVKMLGMLILIASYLIVNENGRVAFALAVFAVFAAHLTLFVVDLAASLSKDKKKSL